MKKSNRDQRTELISIAAEIIGTEQDATVWFDTYELPGFGYTPSELLAKGLYDAVREYIVHADDGHYA